MTPRLTGLKGLHGMRDGVLDRLHDEDLAFSPGGDNISFGRLLAELAALERSYAQSLQDRVQQWPPDGSVSRVPERTSQLRQLFTMLDRDIESAVAGTSAEDTAITRSDGGIRTLDEQVEIYMQALFIFLGKAVVYLRAMGRPLPTSIAHYIG